MSEYCDFEWTGARIPSSPSSVPYTPTKEIPLEKDEALRVLKSKVSTSPGRFFFYFLELTHLAQ